MTIAEILASLPGLTYRQLDHWIAKGYIRAPRYGSGRPRSLAPREVRVLRLMHRLVTDGVNPEQAAKQARRYVIHKKPITIGGFVLQEQDTTDHVA